MGNGPRGLQPQRRRLGLLHPRPGAIARLSLGRGRARRVFRLEAAPVFRPGALEREGPDPERTALRLEQLRREPRRGREGVLLLSRFHADPLVHEVALQISPGGLSLRRSGGHQQAALARGARVRTDQHRCVRPGPLLRRRRRVRQSLTGRVLRPHHRDQPGPGGRDHSSPAQPVVPQHVELVAGRAETASRRGEKGRRCERRGGVSRGARRSLAVLRRGAAAAVHGERHQYRAGLRHAERVSLREGRLPRLPGPRENRCGQPGGNGNQGRRALPPRDRGRPVRVGPAVPHGYQAQGRSVRSL